MRTFRPNLILNGLLLFAAVCISPAVAAEDDAWRTRAEAVLIEALRAPEGSQQCFRHLTPGDSASLLFELEVANSGTVSSARVVEADVDNPALDRCAIELLLGVTLPKHLGKKKNSLQHVLDFGAVRTAPPDRRVVKRRRPRPKSRAPGRTRVLDQGSAATQKATPSKGKTSAPAARPSRGSGEQLRESRPPAPEEEEVSVWYILLSTVLGFGLGFGASRLFSRSSPALPAFTIDDDEVEPAAPNPVRVTLAECCDETLPCTVLADGGVTYPGRFSQLGGASFKVELTRPGERLPKEKSLVNVTFNNDSRAKTFLTHVVRSDATFLMLNLPEQIAATEARSTFRIPCAPDCGLVVQLVSASGTSWKVTPRDVSRMGIGLRLEDADAELFEVGAKMTVSLELRGAKAQLPATLQRASRQQLGLLFRVAEFSNAPEDAALREILGHLEESWLSNSEASGRADARVA